MSRQIGMLISTHSTVQAHRSVEFSEKRRLNLPAFVVVGSIALQYLVQPFEQKRPEPTKGSVVADKVGSVSSVMMIRSNDLWSI